METKRTPGQKLRNIALCLLLYLLGMGALIVAIIAHLYYR